MKEIELFKSFLESVKGKNEYLVTGIMEAADAIFPSKPRNLITITFTRYTEHDKDRRQVRESWPVEYYDNHGNLFEGRIPVETTAEHDDYSHPLVEVDWDTWNTSVDWDEALPMLDMYNEAILDLYYEVYRTGKSASKQL